MWISILHELNSNCTMHLARDAASNSLGKASSGVCTRAGRRLETGCMARLADHQSLCSEAHGTGHFPPPDCP